MFRVKVFEVSREGWVYSKLYSVCFVKRYLNIKKSGGKGKKIFIIVRLNIVVCYICLKVVSFYFVYR